MSDLIIHKYTDSYTLEGKVIARIREFLNTRLDYDAVVSRDLQTDPIPSVMVWIRSLGGVQVEEFGYAYQTLQISVSCADTVEKNGRQKSAEICEYIRAFMETVDFNQLPIIGSDTAGVPFITDSLDTWERPAYTFNASVYQTTKPTIV